MSIIPDAKVREVREKAAILDVVSDYVRLKKAGANFLGLCPFHGEKTPSFSVNPSREIFHCFGCGVGGDVFSFVMRMEGLSFPEAVRFLAGRVGVAIDERPPTAEEKRRADELDVAYRIIEVAAQFYGRLLLDQPEGEAGRLYLDRRAVDLETAKTCRLGFAPDRWDALTRHLEQKRIPLATAVKLGLIRQRDGGGFYDIFRNRLLFTITDTQQHPIAFGGRVLDESLPKYLNSPESSVYHKSEVLYGLDVAKKFIREEGSVFVVEGYFDHLSLFQAGVKNVVATCGTALTARHVQLLKRYADKIYTLFDADAAGKKATFRSMELFLEEGCPAHVVLLPPGEDPDSFLRKHGVAAFAERVQTSRPIFEYYYRDLCRQTDTGSVEGKVKVLEQLTPCLAKMTNPLERDLYIKEVARVVGVEERLLRNRVDRGGNPQAPVVLPPRKVREEKGRGIAPEEMLLSLMGRYREVAAKVREFGVGNLFGDDLLPVAEDILSQIAEKDMVDWPAVLDKVPSPEERNRLAALFVDDHYLEDIDAHKAFDQCRLALERTSLREMKTLARELAAAEPGSAQYQTLLEKIDSLRNKKSRLF